VASQTALEASRETVTTLEEVQRVTAQYEAQQTVLRGDALEVGARLAKCRYELSTAENRVETQREVLNDLMGRDLATRFRIEPIPEQNAEDLGLEAARQRATEDRPEIRQAQLREKQADCERRLARADYIPDLSLSVRYVGLYNFEVLPTHVTTAGLYLSWEPFDWGRRRNRVAEKVKAADQARAGARQTESSIEIEVGQTYRSWRDAALLVSAARAEHEAAREQLRVTAARYQEQAALLKDVLQLEARSAEADSQYQQALSSFWGARAELQRVMGEE